MKRCIFTIVAVIFTAVCSKLNAQSEAEMKAWMENMTPGDFHKEMAKWDGDWNEEITMWMSPVTPPMKYIASCTNKMILGGRFQNSTHKGDIGGMPFEGISTIGYDNARKKFVATWIDNMGTGILYMEGDWDEKTKSLEMKGEQVDPSNGKLMKVREVFKVMDDNTHRAEMYTTNEGSPEFKSMEIVYTRKK